MMQEVIDRVKSQSKLSAIISTRVKLSSNGASRFKGLCPFHNEKTASFHVDDSRGIYKCFGCGEGGDVFEFVKKTYNLSDFKDAILQTAKLSGIELNEEEIYGKSKEDSQHYQSEKKVTYEINAEIMKIFRDNLKNNLNAKEYLLKNRRIPDAIIDNFQLGYASNSYNELIEQLKGRGYNQKQILESGIAKELNKSIYTIFRDRIIIPILNLRGECIGFGGRSMHSDVQPKYLNSFESKIFKKGETLYNIDKAKELYNSGQHQVVLSEGYMDVIALHKAGVAAVAPLGTSITSAQVLLIKKHFSKIVLWLDSDKAGETATMKAIKIFLEHLDETIEIFCINQTEAKDPDEYINKHGTHATMEEIKKSIPLHVYILQKLSQKTDFKNPVDTAKLRKNLSEMTSLVKNQLLRSEYVKYFNDQLYERKFSRNSTSKKKKMPNISPSGIDKVREIEGLIVACIAKRKDLIESEEFDFELQDYDFQETLTQIMSSDESIDLAEIETMKDIKHEVICQDERIVHQFTRLCISHKIAKIDTEMQNLLQEETGVITDKFPSLVREKQILLEKIKKYPI